MMLEAVIGLLVMEVDKVADEVTDMEVDKVTNMMAKITNADFSDMTWYYGDDVRVGGQFTTNASGATC